MVAVYLLLLPTTTFIISLISSNNDSLLFFFCQSSKEGHNEAVAWLDERTFCITFRQQRAANLYRKWLTSTEMDCVEPVDGK